MLNFLSRLFHEIFCPDPFYAVRVASGNGFVTVCVCGNYCEAKAEMRRLNSDGECAIIIEV